MTSIPRLLVWIASDLWTSNAPEIAAFEVATSVAGAFQDPSTRPFVDLTWIDLLASAVPTRIGAFVVLSEMVSATTASRVIGAFVVTTVSEESLGRAGEETTKMDVETLRA